MANFTNWQAYAGSCAGRIDTISPSPAIPGRHTIMNAQQLMITGQMQDEQCPSIPKVPTGFNYSAKLGNASTGAEVDALEYTMTIDSTNSLLIIHFAWLMEDPAHDPLDQPYFDITIKDTLDRIITNFSCGGGAVFITHGLDDLVCQTSSFLARNWTAFGLSLLSLMGETVKIYFETRDCTQGGHFGYAYIVAECRPLMIDLVYCQGQNTARLHAPDGFVYYKWTRSSQPSWTVAGQGKQFQNFSVYNLVEGEEFTCEVTSELGCSDTLRAVVARTIINTDFAFGVMENGNVDIVGHNNVSWYDTCNRTVTFVDLSTVTNSEKESIQWEIDGLNVLSFDSLFTYTFPESEKNEPVEYRIRLTVIAENGCIDTSSQHITVYPSPQIKIDGNNRLCEGDTLYLKAVSIRSEFANHTWTWVDTNNIPQTASGDSIQVDNFGTYILVSKSIFGCFARDTFKVTVPKLTLNNLSITHVNCYGEATGNFIHGTISGGQSPYISFTWTFPDKDGNDSLVEVNSYFAMFLDLKAGIYRFNAMDAGGCALSGEIEIKQNDSLKITAIQYAATSGLENGKLKLAATGGVPPYKFKIEKEDATLVISSDTASNLSAGVYTITVTDAVNCITSDTISVTVLDVGILDITNTNSSIIVYPNPANTQLHVKLGTQETENYAIYNVTGQIIMQGKLSAELSIINIESLMKGVYYLKIMGKETATIRFVKQ
jgi:hypothetical protein